mmetsp:Transcript_20014/g.41230  ORF Transcript_20014/g.41230 Transcript_20014/m.41230 type:complete len:145 (-) Transcript_20014:81-515(-)
MVKKDTTVVLGLFICLHFFGSFCDAFNPNIRRPDTPILVYSTPGGGRHSYVEGGDYDDVFSEIEAMGGDPFFLDDEESKVKMADKESAILPEKSVSDASPKKADKRSATDGMGPTPRKNDNPDKSDSAWEWDGTVDEEAHLGWD